MKQATPLAVIATGQEPSQSAEAGVLELGLPKKLTTENLAHALDQLAAAVPDRVGHDVHAQHQERLVAQGIMRVLEAVRDYAPANPWGRNPLLDEAKKVVKARKDASGKKERFQSNTPLVTQIARVTYPDSRRAHGASKVIRAALEAGKTSNELLDFIEQSGGMEAIRRNSSGTAVDDALDLMWKTEPLATISLPKELVGEQVNDHPKVMLFTVRHTGEIDIRWVGDGAASTLTAFAKAQKDKSIGTPDTSTNRFSSFT